MGASEETKRVDIAVVGAGPAGLTAALYARRAGKSVAVFEALVPGGQIVNTPDIENYPGTGRVSGFDFADRLRTQAEEAGAEIVYERVAAVRAVPGGGGWEIATDSGTRRARAVVLATGARTRPLGVEGEERLVGRGISYCATCDGAFYRGKDVAVVGGGNTALEDAAYLAGVVRKVYLVHRRHEFRGDAATAERLRAAPNVEFVLGSTVKRLAGEARLEGVEVEETATGARRVLEVSGLFVAVGRVPETGAFTGLVALSPDGSVAAGEDCVAGPPGLFVAGDVRAKAVRQLVTAAADGAVAATAAVQYLQALPPA